MLITAIQTLKTKQGDTSEAYLEIYNKVKSILWKKSLRYYLTPQQVEDFITDAILKATSKFDQDADKGFMSLIGVVFENEIKRHLYNSHLDMRKANQTIVGGDEVLIYQPDSKRSGASPIEMFKENLKQIKLTSREKAFIEKVLFYESITEATQHGNQTVQAGHYRAQSIKNKLKKAKLSVESCYV